MRTKLILLFLSISLCGCINREDHIGYSFPEGYEKHLKIGKTSRHRVFDVLVSPSTESNYGQITYYYVGQIQSIRTLEHPKVDKQNILALTFNKKGILQSIKHYNIADYKQLSYDERRTILKGNEMGVLEQMIHNIGRFGGKNKAANR